ncbi:hypothetical protein ACWECC_29170 [Streptomyces microflavus]
MSNTSPSPAGNNSGESATKTSAAQKVERIALWATIAASIGGLVFTGLGLREQAEATQHAGDQAKYQGKTYEDQVDQQRKRQARLLNVWPRLQFGDGRRQVVIVNRSNEPIYRLRVYVSFADSYREKEKGEISLLSLGTLPPCVQIDFDLNAVARVDPATEKALNGSKKMDYGVLFVDSAGKAFHRHVAGEINPNPWLEFLEGEEQAPDIPEVFEKFTRHGPEGDAVTALSSNTQGVAAGPSRAQACGDAS